MFELTFEPVAGRAKITDFERITSKLSSTSDRKLRSAYKNARSLGKKLVIDKRFIDARRGKARIKYRFDFLSEEEICKRNEQVQFKAFPYLGSKDLIDSSLRPVVVGFGPAGIFASYILAKYGLRPLIIERGSSMKHRVNDVSDYINGIKDINPNSNIQFGEGGAGTFSDGKLYTGINSGLKSFVTRVFVDNGAPEDILYDSHPHIGTDVLREVIVNIRNQILSMGGEIHFNTRLVDVVTKKGKVCGITVDSPDGEKKIDCDRLIIAIGNSSRDTFRSLYSGGVSMESKPFAVGVRIEHKRKDIDISQYGIDTATTNDLTAAYYKLSVDTKTGRKLYTFCMCPGGEVINAASGKNEAVVNGMSYRSRDLENSNCALLVPVDSKDYGNDVLSGIEFQENLEQKALMATKSDFGIPVTRYKDLKSGNIHGEFFKIKPSVKHYVSCDFNEIFPEEFIDTLADGISEMGKKIKGFDDPESVLSAVESRSSSPVRITRDFVSLQSTNIVGLFPSGEGAGYAGGIMSSAIDGINCANSLVNSLINS